MGNSATNDKCNELRNLLIDKDGKEILIRIKSFTRCEDILDIARKKLGSRSIMCLESKVSEVLDSMLCQENFDIDRCKGTLKLFAVEAEEILDDFSIEAFKPIKILGKGGASTVVMVRKKDTGMIYAVKTIEKSLFDGDDKINQIVTEKDILSQLKHPFIATLYLALETKQKLHLIMEFIPGGELFFYLQNYGKFTEDHAKFYFCEVLLALDYLHKQNIIYRDLKPENILLDAQGHIKVVDFGLAKQGISRESLSFSFCGSPEYMSPEMITGSAHGRAVDYYSLGTLLYEMVTGLPPYYSHNRHEMQQNITNKVLELPDFLSKTCKSLLKGLLQKEPENRIGYAKGIDEIKQHPWCRGSKWSRIFLKNTVPPMLPSIKSSTFTPEFTAIPIGPEFLLDEPNLKPCQNLGNFSYISKEFKKKNKIIRKSYETAKKKANIERFPSNESKTTKAKSVIEQFSDSEGISFSFEAEYVQPVKEIRMFEAKFFHMQVYNKK